MASTSLTDSEAAFRKQSGNLGLHQDWIDGLIAVGVSNLGRLAFACGQPGAPTQDADVTNLLTSTGVVRVISVGDICHHETPDLWGADVGDQFSKVPGWPKLWSFCAEVASSRAHGSSGGAESKTCGAEPWGPLGGCTLRLWSGLWDAGSWQPQVCCTKPMCDTPVRDHIDEAAKGAQAGFQLHRDCGAWRAEWSDLPHYKWAWHLWGNDKEVTCLRCRWADPVWSLPTMGWLHVSTSTSSTTSWLQCSNHHPIAEDRPPSIRPDARDDKRWNQAPSNGWQAFGCCGKEPRDGPQRHLLHVADASGQGKAFREAYKEPGQWFQEGWKRKGLELEAVVAQAVMEEIWDRSFARGLEGLLFLYRWREEAMLCIQYQWLRQSTTRRTLWQGLPPLRNQKLRGKTPSLQLQQQEVTWTGPQVGVATGGLRCVSQYLHGAIEPLWRFSGEFNRSSVWSISACESCITTCSRIMSRTDDWGSCTFCHWVLLWDRRFDCTTSQVWATPITWGGPYHQSRPRPPCANLTWQTQPPSPSPNRGCCILFAELAHEPGRFHWDLMLRGHCAATTTQKVLKTSLLQSANVWTLQMPFMLRVVGSSFVASSMQSDGHWSNHIDRFSGWRSTGSRFYNIVSQFSQASMLACMGVNGQSKQPSPQTSLSWWSWRQHAMGNMPTCHGGEPRKDMQLLKRRSILSNSVVVGHESLQISFFKIIDLSQMFCWRTQTRKLELWPTSRPKSHWLLCLSSILSRHILQKVHQTFKLVTRSDSNRPMRSM